MTEASRSEVSPGRRAAVAIGVTAALCLAVAVLAGEAAYPWLKAVHVIAVISWMAGMLYLPRLFIYHTEAAPGSEMSATFKVMERRLLTLIINPAMILTWALGLWLAWQGGHFGAGWFHAKLALVLALSGVHGFFSASVRRFAEDRNTRSVRQWRIWNEVPAVLMVGIVILVVVKPF
ncbi:MAG: protoporphyrinogen oxidase HemJ [Hyphomicrobium sp.]|uniref:protoporphyrinogen oxidase HemJ n=1 Tax=Hyphomicrobium sp. TaxID=82 RepID=UPI003D10BF6A